MTPRVQRLAVRAGVIGTIALLSACDERLPAGPTPSTGGSNVITISRSGVTPREIQIRAGSRVTFTNTDTTPHEISSDPHPEHTGCPPINQVGFLTSGQTRETGNFVDPGRCGFHDHIDPGDAAFMGTIIVTP